VLEYVRVPAKAGSVVAFVSDPSHSRRQIWAIGSPKEGSTPRQLFLSWHPVLTVYAYAGQNDPPSWLEDESPQRRHLECLSMTWVNRGIPMLNFETTARCVSLREHQTCSRAREHREHATRKNPIEILRVWILGIALAL
jgi:hypothetical protein